MIITIRGSGGVVRLSISPSQGDDPGFKSRPEQIRARKKYKEKKNSYRISQSGKFSSSFPAR
jgi:hypothetical protein